MILSLAQVKLKFWSTDKLEVEGQKAIKFEYKFEKGHAIKKKKKKKKKKKQLNTAENRTAKIQTDQMCVAFGLLTLSFSAERDFS